MIEINKHKFFLLEVLKDIYSDAELASRLAFKGGTAMMLFYELPRFSVDLDFNLIGEGGDAGVYSKIKKVLTSYGSLHDEAKKHHGMLIVLNYEHGGRKLKIEISSRNYPDKYELKDYLGISMNVMRLEYMFTHKLSALLDRRTLTHRDVFDSWFCMNKRVMLKKSILDLRLECTFEQYMDNCIKAVSNIKPNRVLDGLGELMDQDLKKWVKQNLISEFVALARMYKTFPLVD